MQKYLNDFNRLQVYATMTAHYLMNIILNGMTFRLGQARAYYEYLCSDLSKSQERLLHIYFITIQFHRKEQDNNSKCLKKKHALEEQA